MAQWLANPTRIHEDAGMWVPSLASLSGLRIRRCHELQCRSQTQLRSHIAVAVVQASSYSSDSTPSLGTSICLGCGPKKQSINQSTVKKKKKTHLHLDLFSKRSSAANLCCLPSGMSYSYLPFQLQICRLVAQIVLLVTLIFSLFDNASNQPIVMSPSAKECPIL